MIRPGSRAPAGISLASGWRRRERGITCEIFIAYPDSSVKRRCIRKERAMLDDANIDFDCPQCGHKITKTIGWLTSHKNTTCPGCSVTIDLDTDDLSRGIKEIDKALDSFPKEITIKF
jgi:transcription elongation factor Elf1